MWNAVPLEWKLQCKLPSRVGKWRTDPIKVPQVVLKQVQLWKANPLLILDPGPVVVPSSDDFAAKLYLSLEGIHKVEVQSKTVDVIRERIIQIVLHCLLNKLGLHQIHPDTVAETEFLRRLNIRKDDQEAVERSKQWAAMGRKLHSFSMEFALEAECLGPVICMPRDITRNK